MGLTHEHKAPAPGQRGPGQRSTRHRTTRHRTTRLRTTRLRTTPLLAAIGLTLGLLSLLLVTIGPASAAPPPPAPSFPVTVGECHRGGWADFPELGFRNQGGCVRWVQAYVVRPRCADGALADFQATGPTFARQLRIPLGPFIATVCRGQDFPVSNASYVVDDPAGTDLLSLAAGHTVPFVAKPGYIYWIQVQGDWLNGTLAVDAAYVSDDGWVTWADGPAGRPLQTQTQIDRRFVDWGAYDSRHHYQYWVHGDGTPINMRVFEGFAGLNLPVPAWYADNVNPDPAGGVPAIVFEYRLWR